ncbi:ABC transporter permease [Aeromicrobium phragmitis]|uniref:ABC transporter permease n=1 Tax=Aeromicrobium phragmitis TaxID=2478914 RepID=A0A3L8PM11_9ACTN|nr:ABC transporter permease [Aeromicrobium phragmitis]RLV56300.1 ABC transporter permease [Aeromicrobium phragmitis]
MSGIGSALRVEFRKSLASPVLRAITVFVVVGIALLSGALVSAALAGNAQVTAQLGHLAGTTGWPLLTGLVAQVTAAGGLLAFGVALSWMFGREFAEGTIAGLFGLPVTRASIAAAKLLVYAGWVVGVSAGLVILVAGAGMALGLGTVDAGVIESLARQFILTVLSGLLAVPAAWAATLGRGYLPGVAGTIGLLALAQIAVVADTRVAAWLPIAAPALWALFPDQVDHWQLLAALAVPLAFGVLTIRSWRRLRFDR